MARKGGVGSPPHGPPSLLLLRGLASSSGRSTRALRSPSPQRQGRAKYSRRRGEGMEKQRSTGREASSCETIRTGGRSCRGGGEGVRGGGVRRGRGRRALEPSCSCQQARRGSAERARPAPASLRRRRGRAPRRPRSADEPARLGDGETREGAPGLERSLSAVPRPPPPAPAPPPAAPSACPTPPSRSPLLAGPTPPSSDSKPRPFAALPPSPGSTDGETSGLLRLGPSAKASAPATDVNRKKAKNFATQPHLPSSSEKLPGRKARRQSYCVNQSCGREFLRAGCIAYYRGAKKLLLPPASLYTGGKTKNKLNETMMLLLGARETVSCLVSLFVVTVRLKFLIVWGRHYAAAG
nr:serine/arginine repetitive matrix protein 1 isoform X7 [Oryctolagus cuniculus]